MKAKSLKKVPEVIENIYHRISEANANSQFKIFIPHFIYVPESVKIQLINDGYKVYKGTWNAMEPDCLIIEW